jgi:hypothetical protein
MKLLRRGFLVFIVMFSLAVLYALYSTAAGPKDTTQAIAPDAATRSTLLSFSPHPQWVGIPSDAPGMSEYIDKLSIITKGNIVSVWNLGDFSPSVEAMLFFHDRSFNFPRSIAHEQQFDCLRDLDHIVAAINFTGHMAHGEMIVQPAYIEDWGTVTDPAEVAEYKIVCPVSDINQATSSTPLNSQATLPANPSPSIPQQPSASVQAQPNSPPTSTDDISSTFAAIIGIIFALYFLPWFIALSRHVENHLTVLLVNFLLGWSGLGWLISLFMAISMETREAKEIRRLTLKQLQRSERER